MSATTESGPARQPVRPPAADRAGKRRRKGRGATRVHPALYLFPLPALAVYIVFFAIPTLQAVQYSTTDWDGFSADYENVGLGNFERLATNDDLFTNALSNNLKFMIVVVVFQTLLGLLLAIFLVRNTTGSLLLRGLFFFPTILSSVSVAYIWKFVYDPNFGLANTVLEAVGLEQFTSSYLGNDAAAIYWVALTQIWFHAGQMMVIFIAGLQMVPSELYEAAEIDGAGKWRQFTSITWPMIAPATAIVVAYTTIQSFKAFDLILGLSGNPPRHSLDILSTRIYSTFTNSQFGYAAAESLVFMAFIAAIVIVQRRLLKLTQKDV
ncbi:carbohydrate ABC transporter permease [Phytoactinopolyspora halophila]|uniref:carbohydrate ABC transporter permease n=1 Tax=Phytoactinopolyspora halophila TaxID=1981511 RepID=UPI001B8B74DD|nr:sugar ABC transporter permease [Phytoactinopolyspora halophila]